jgi:hypothetical protein
MCFGLCVLCCAVLTDTIRFGVSGKSEEGVCLRTYNAVVVLFDDDGFGRWTACWCVIFVCGYYGWCGLNGISVSFLFNLYIYFPFIFIEFTFPVGVHSIHLPHTQHPIPNDKRRRTVFFYLTQPLLHTIHLSTHQVTGMVHP